jgi:hypothetical protein
MACNASRVLKLISAVLVHEDWQASPASRDDQRL